VVRKVTIKSKVLSGDYMSYYCTKEMKACEFANVYGHCNVTACTKINRNNMQFLDTSISYNKTFEEELEEKRKVAIAEGYLEGLGVKIKTDMYGYYRNTWDILLDLGEYLSKNNT